MGEPRTIEAWARELIACENLALKLAPGDPPASFASPLAAPRRVESPGRGPGLRVLSRAEKTPRPGALSRPEARARLLHTFLHHEVQAAELFAWALLAFPGAPESFRRGLLRLAEDELRHARMLAGCLERLGHAYGDFGVRDWFWQRLPSCEEPVAFVALLGLGLEAANLDHAERWARYLEQAGDTHAAEVQRTIAREEIEHVRFAAEWFRAWTGGLEFERWREALPPPLTPTPLRGPELDREARRAAGLDEDFLRQLEAWGRSTSGT